MNGRIYASKLGRMLSPDPVTQAPENGQNHNRYTYAYNNPLKYTDPSGYQIGEIGNDPSGIGFGSIGSGISLGFSGYSDGGPEYAISITGGGLM